MRFGPVSILASALLIVSAIPASAKPKVRRSPTSPRVLKTKARATPQGIAPERATQIQTALIKAGYMGGSPSGAWDSQTQAAMEKLQADNGWQTKFVPDSRAIIKLGLGSNAGPSTALATAPGEEPGSPASISDPASNPAASNR